MRLCDVEINSIVKVVSLNCEINLTRRLNDLGLVRGTSIAPVFIAPFGNPIAYEFRGNIIAIRNEDSANILVDI